MSNYEPDTTSSLPDAVDALGVDGDGRSHFSTPATLGPVTVYVETDDGFDVFELAETPCGDLEDWIAHVDAQRGWNHLLYSDTDDPFATLLESLSDSLEEAV
jgi:hypothetical protein